MRKTYRPRIDLGETPQDERFQDRRFQDLCYKLGRVSVKERAEYLCEIAEIIPVIKPEQITESCVAGITSLLRAKFDGDEPNERLLDIMEKLIKRKPEVKEWDQFTDPLRHVANGKGIGRDPGIRRKADLLMIRCAIPTKKPEPSLDKKDGEKKPFSARPTRAKRGRRPWSLTLPVRPR